MANEFNMHGGYFSPPGYLKVETGGSHDENPNGGVQIGVDPNGVPNMLEEVEPVYDDYVYSDNINADKDILAQFNIPEKYAGKLYSEIADVFVDEAEDRPLDSISNNGLRAMLGRLANAQEQQKQEEEQKALEKELEQLSPEELDELEAMLAAQEGAVPTQPQPVVMPEAQAPVEEVSQMQPQVMAMGGLMNKFDGFGNSLLNVAKKVADNVDLSQVGKKKKPNFLDGSVVGDMIKGALAEKRAAGLPQDTLNNFVGLNSSLFHDDVLNPTFGKWRISQVQQQENQKNADDIVYSDSSLPTWMRYGALGHGLLGMYNAFTPPTRFSIQRAVPHYPTGQINLQDMTYNPLDYSLTENAILANSAGTVRALRNSGLGPSTPAAIIATDRNVGQNLGTGFIQGWDANNRRLNDVIAVKNNNAAQRASFNFQVDAARAKALEDTQRINIYNELTRQRLNDEAETQQFAALSNELGYSLDALSKMGNENLSYNMVNSSGLDYEIGKDGRVRYKKNNASNGGTLLKKHKK